MRLGMAQMSVSRNIEENVKKTLSYLDRAKGCDLVFFPEVQLTPFFAQYPKRDVSQYCMAPDGPEAAAIAAKARELGMYVSPNLYLRRGESRCDTSLWIDRQGHVADSAAMVHILNAENFWEQDYYTPSDEGFKVFDTEFGKVGIVICFDRHLPESIRTCALRGAELIIVPTANHKAEPMELFEWEMRVQAMHNQVFIAMCNRVGREDQIDFAGESLIVHPSGELLFKADDAEQLITLELDLNETAEWKKKRPFLKLRRPEFYA